MSTDAWTGLRAVGLACGAAAMLAACFSERSSGGPAGVTGECTLPAADIAAGHRLVAIDNFLFTPDSIAVPVGATVTWVNCENVQVEDHTTTSDANLWDSGQYPGGQSFSHTFPTAGTFPYHCSVHPGMVGKVVVQ